MKDSEFDAAIVGSIAKIGAKSWNALLPPRGSPGYHPFTDYAFLSALEDSGCASADAGWAPCHLMLTDNTGACAGAAPLYRKTHSMGEYVFDHGWANASERAGVPYYPKLQCAIPFTPVTGPRLLAHSPEAQTAIVHALRGAAAQLDSSGVHITFGAADIHEQTATAGFLARTDRQFHFINKNYHDFDEFLGALSSRKRKKIRAERRKANEKLKIVRLQGDDLKSEHWDAFFNFYIDTSMRKWGQPYLNREFFSLIHENMHQQVLLILAYDGADAVAGALNFIGGDALYGRHWGALSYYPCLHFELCFYQAIEAVIEFGLARAEAGAQGEHKLARGYEPVLTRSAHYLRFTGLHNAIEDFLAQERRAIDGHMEILGKHTPFKR